MKLRRNKDEDELDELEETPKARKKKVEIKDLKPQNKRKRKEPPKPWGKGERYLVLSLLLSTALISAVLALSARSGKLPGLPRLQLPKHFFEQTYILDKSTSPTNNLEDIENQIDKSTSNLAGVYGVYVLRPFEDVSYGTNEHEEFPAGSLLRLPLMVSAYIESEEGRLNLESEYLLKNENKVKGPGSLYYKEEGAPYTYRELLDLIGQQSDSTAINVLRQKLGEDLIQEYIYQFGMQSTSFSTQVTSPYDMATLFEKIVEDKLINSSNKKELLDSLTDTIYEAWLRAGVPKSIEVPHVYARSNNSTSDVGLVWSDKPYIIAILSKGSIESESDQALPELSLQVYDFESHH